MAQITAVVVDDSQSQVSQAHVALRQNGFEVLATATNGAVGMDLIRTLQPTVAVIDYMMPGMTGAEIIKAIKEEGLETKVVLATSMGQSGALAASLADSVLIKPFNAMLMKLALYKLGLISPA